MQYFEETLVWIVSLPCNYINHCIVPVIKLFNPILIINEKVTIK